jgi:hypothetical protein
MEHSISYNEYKKMIQNGKYKENIKGLAKKLIVLKENGHITQEEHNDLLLLWISILVEVTPNSRIVSKHE